MGKYIALLRGINVGGNNKISMPELKTAFEKSGFNKVVTYINSGNIIFESGEKDVAVLRSKCESLIAGNFNLKIPVGVISAAELVQALKHSPPWWNEDTASKHNAIFVIPPASTRKVVEAVGATKPEYEKTGCYGNVIFWSAPLVTFSHTRWSKIVQSKLYDSITIRNANTTIKLAELVKKD